MRLYRIVVLALTALMLTACNKQDSNLQQTRLFAFSNEVDVSLYNVSPAKAEKAFNALRVSFDKDNQLWHAWHPSELTRINQAISQGKSITVSDEVARVIQQAKTLSKQSNDLFNPAAGKLFQLWGYERDDWLVSHAPPKQSDIDTWLNAHPTMADIEVDGNTIRSDNPMVQLGFDGFAKAYAINTAIDILKKQGIDNAVVKIGGDLRAIGSDGDHPWLVTVRHPQQQGAVGLIAVSQDQSVFTSDNVDRYFSYQGKKYPHIMDPRTGYPARDVAAVTVMTDDAATADAAATAMVVAGNDWPKIAGLMHVSRVMLIRADGQIEVSPDMADRVQLTNNSPAPTIREIPSTTKQ